MTTQSREQTQGGLSNYETPYMLNALTLRLDTNPILEKVENFLNGYQQGSKRNNDGTIEYYKFRPQGVTAKANTKGINMIMNYIQLVFNSHVVQGNLTKKDYNDLVRETHEFLSEYIWVNMNDWEIAEEDYPLVVRGLIHLLIPFMSRTIDNKERDSYMNFMRSSETVVENKGGNGLPFIGNFGKK